MKKNKIKIIIILLVIVFFIEAIIYLQSERIQKDLYRLRKEIIEIKNNNRALLLKYRKIINVENMNKWAKKNGFTEYWIRPKEKEENEKQK